MANDSDDTMVHLAVAGTGGCSVVRVTGIDDDTTVRTLLRVLGEPVDAEIDGSVRDPDSTLRVAGITEGSVVGPSGGVRAGLALEVVSGPLAGTLTPLEDGHHVVTIDGTVSPIGPTMTVAPTHALLIEVEAGTVAVAAVGPTRVVVGLQDLDAAIDPGDAVIGLATSDVRIIDHLGDAPLPAPRRFDRPPRALAPPRPVTAISVDDLDTLDGQRPPLPILSLLAPLIMGLTMAVLLNPMFAVFTAVSPVLLLARWCEGAMRARRAQRSTARQEAEAIAHIRAAIETDRDRAHRLAHDADPALGEVARVATTHQSAVWQRRPAHHDFSSLRLGLASIPHEIELTGQAAHRPALRGLGEAADLPCTPLTVDLDAVRCLTIAGDRGAARRALRALVLRMVVDRAPSDLSVRLLTDDRAAWLWTWWLPHLEDETPPLGPARRLVIIDGAEQLHRAGAELRGQILEDPTVWSIVLTDDPDTAPACSGAIVSIGCHGAATMTHYPAERSTPLRLDGCRTRCAERVARALARLSDPDLEIERQLAATVDWRTISGDLCAAGVARRWRDGAGRNRLCAAIGMGDDGPVEVDLVAAGPHALIAGTTGSGKSELLRTLVAGLAANHGPDAVTFLLIDFKGGGAFDACAELPHTLAVVTDLDQHEAERALQSLTAELRHREETLRRLGSSSLEEAAGSAETPPRLVVVVDEFATLAAELPTFLDALVDVAQRGRSLGVHLVLATQRPSGVLDGKIRANTNLRIALRVQDDADSIDVVDVVDAARIDPARAGRAVLRVGPLPPQPFQTARCTTPATAHSHTGLQATSVLDLTERKIAPASSHPEKTTLASFVEAARTAHGTTAEPRSIWLPPLPARLDPSALDRSPTGCATVIGIADIPERQAQEPVLHDVGTNLVTIGGDRPATSSALTAIALAIADRHDPAELHMHVVDGPGGALAALAGLPHVGAYVRADDTHRLGSLVRMLRRDLHLRRDAPGPQPAVVVIIDGLAHALDDHRTTEVLDALAAILRDGPTQAMSVIGSAEHERAVPHRLLHLFDRRLVFELADPLAHATFGVRARDLPRLGDHRCYDAATTEAMTLVAAPSDPARAVAELRGRYPEHPGAPGLEELTDAVALDDLLPGSRGSDGLLLPVGRGIDLAPLCLHVREHAVIAGGARAGKTTALVTAATQLQRIAPRPRIVTVASNRSPIAAFADVVVDPTNAAELEQVEITTATVVLVDDADRLTEPVELALRRLVDLRLPSVHVIAAGRTDALRSFQSWTTCLRESRTGIVLRPAPGDGDLLRVQPAAPPARQPAGRGWLVVDGEVQTIQLATTAA